jgi:5-methylcytosine-specific restriction protein B
VAGTDGRVEMAYFHPNYTYEDFIQGLRPVVENKILRYEMEDGIFKRFCEEAEENDTEPYVMMIDEINRAKLSRVFGELMYLLEYRDKEVTLGSGGKKFRIPDNVYLIGTMNTADRSIALVDHALRRRFTFITIPPNYEVLTKYLEKHDLPAKQVIDTLRTLNHEINDPKFEVGISFFMRSGPALKKEMRNIWQGEIEPYLREFFYDTPKKLEQFTWEALSTSSLSDYA